MPYNRPLKESEPPSPEILVPIFEKAIKSLVQRFRNHPYAFYTESDMHCYLYHRLYSGGIVNGLYPTVEDHDTILLHKEYPTFAKYVKTDDGMLKESVEGRRRGAFDISIWDPRFLATLEHRKQKVLCAAELALNECGMRRVHILNDLTKLAGPTNEIRYGYLLFFVRDNGEFKKNENKIRETLEDAAKRVRVAFAQVDGKSKPKPEFLGAWGVV
jgi:hypothetical protein